MPSQHATYQEPPEITEQRKQVLHELQKAAKSHSGILQEVLLKIYQVVQNTTPDSNRDARLTKDTQLAIQQYLNARKSGKVSSEIPQAIPLAVEFIQNNIKVLGEATRLETEGKPLEVKEFKGIKTFLPSLRTIHFDNDALELTPQGYHRQVFLGEYYATNTITQSPRIRTKTPGWVNPALGHIIV